MMDKSKLYLLLLGLLQQAEAEVTNADQGDFLNDVQSMASWLLGYGEESTIVFKNIVRESRVLVGEWSEQLTDATVDIVDATVESIKYGFEGAKSEVKVVHKLFTSRFETVGTNVDSLDDIGTIVEYADIDSEDIDKVLTEIEIIEDEYPMVEEIDIIMEEEDIFDDDLYNVFEVFRTRSELIAQAVTELYNGMTSDDENFRFDLILDQISPDFSSYYYLCPNSCSTCNLTMSEMMCRICCPDMFSDPISFTDIFMENSYSAMVTSWVQNSFSWSGLRMVYQNWIQENDRDQHVMASKELSAFIRNFNWLRKVMKGQKFNSSLPAVNVYRDESEEEDEVMSDDVCGYYENGKLGRPEGRIMGGEEVDRMRLYPWQMSLATGFMGMFYQHRCGAALLSDKWVVTAAHCLHTLQGQTLYVMGGFLNINKKETAQVRKVEAYFNHENFVPVLYEQDISLLRLSSPIVYTPSLLPVCLPRPGVSYSAHLGLTAVLTGWGRQWDEGPLSSQLEVVELPIISNTECMDWYNRSGSRQFIPEHTFLCAGWEEGAMDACSGDSGGPLVVTRGDGRAEVIGIVSWGIGCGVKGRPGVYTRVSQYTPWIESKMREYEETY